MNAPQLQAPSHTKLNMNMKRIDCDICIYIYISDTRCARKCRVGRSRTAGLFYTRSRASRGPRPRLTWLDLCLNNFYISYPSYQRCYVILFMFLLLPLSAIFCFPLCRLPDHVRHMAQASLRKINISLYVYHNVSNVQYVVYFLCALCLTMIGT